jgi:hypothetical protein
MEFLDGSPDGFPDSSDQIIVNGFAADRDRQTSVPRNHAAHSRVGPGMLENGHGKESP